MLRALFPTLVVEGSTHSPGPLKEYASAALTYTGYAALAYMLLGAAALAPLGVVEPPWLAAQREARYPLVIAFFLLNQLGGGLKATGAYEATLNGQLIYSKLATNAVPSTAFLVQRIIDVTGLQPDAAVLEQVGLRL